jgi:hypothetical protein
LPSGLSLASWKKFQFGKRKRWYGQMENKLDSFFEKNRHRNKRIFHFRIPGKLLPFLLASGLKFLESGNINAVEETSFKTGPYLPKSRSSFHMRWLRKRSSKSRATRQTLAQNLSMPPYDTALILKIVNFYDILSDLNKKMILG